MSVIGRWVVAELNENANPPNGERWIVLEVSGPPVGQSHPLRIVAYYHTRREARAAADVHNARRAPRWPPRVTPAGGTR
jgi:hypothetical protein